MQDQEITILRELIIILAVSLPITYLFHRAKLPALVGFLITGVLIGPYGAAIITETRVVERLADIGVVLLLFTVGLEFSITDIIRSGRQLLIGGGTQVLLTIAAVTGIALLFHYPLPQAVFFGFLASLSSTAIVLKMYSDRTELDSAHGRLATGILLFQDIAVVPMMLMLPVLGEASAQGAVTPLSVLISLGKAVLGLIGVFFAARQVVPFLLHQVIRLRNREMFFLLIVLLCLGTAWITYSLGLSLALGAFLAGLIISESEYSHHIVVEIMPFRDYFASIFFISIGMLLQTDYFMAHWLLLVIMALPPRASEIRAGGRDRNPSALSGPKLPARGTRPGADRRIFISPGAAGPDKRPDGSGHFPAVHQHLHPEHARSALSHPVRPVDRGLSARGLIGRR